MIYVRTSFLFFVGGWGGGRGGGGCEKCLQFASFLKFAENLKTDSFVLIKTWELKIGLAYSLLYYDIINLLNCKTDLIFIAYSQRSHYIQSSVIFWVVCVKIASLNIVTDIISYA